MKIGKIVLAGVMFLILGNNAIAQEGMEEFYFKSYERALRYNDRAEAKSNLYKLLELDPQNDSLMVTLAYLYYEARQYPSNVLVCMDALAINPQNTGALEMMSASYDNLGLKDKALENYEKLYLLTDDFQTLYKMAFLQFDLEKYHQCNTNVDILLQAQEAEEATVFFTIEEEEKEIPVKAALLNLKGLANKELGNSEEAKQNFQEALQLSPEFVFAQQNLDAMNE
jgi:tetratricopeptide (TPR) repeat protein